MCFFFSFVPASVFTTLSYVVWVLAAASEGGRQTAGYVLAVWLVVVALGFIACGTYVTLAMKCPMEEIFRDKQQAAAS